MIDNSETIATIKLLADIELDLRLYHIEVQESQQQLYPTTPPPPPNYQFCNNDIEDYVNQEHWRRCFAEVEGADCFNFDKNPSIMFSS